jgi:molybdate transport system substrate-binding protein
MKSLRAGMLAFLLACAIAPASSAQRPEILVSAAASLTDVLTGLAPRAEQAIGAKVLFNFGASGALRRQIEEGAPVDVFFSASSEDMDTLTAEGFLTAATRKDLLSNRMVLIRAPGGGAAPAPGATADAEADALKAIVTDAALVAIGNPDTVPAGRYAVQALESYGLYDIVKSKLVLGGNVREVLQYVQSGSAPVGIVFMTDALAAPSGSVQQLFVFPESSTLPILYPVAVVRASKHPEAAARMIRFLQGDAARGAFRQAGFILK